MLYRAMAAYGFGGAGDGDRRQYDFETKLLIVRRHLKGVSGRVLAEEYDLPSPSTVANWTGITDATGEDGFARRGGAGGQSIARIHF